MRPGIDPWAQGRYEGENPKALKLKEAKTREEILTILERPGR
jgi:hypothetical protein